MVAAYIFARRANVWRLALQVWFWKGSGNDSLGILHPYVHSPEVLFLDLISISHVRLALNSRWICSSVVITSSASIYGRKAKPFRDTSPETHRQVRYSQSISPQSLQHTHTPRPWLYIPWLSSKEKKVNVLLSRVIGLQQVNRQLNAFLFAVCF